MKPVSLFRHYRQSGWIVLCGGGGEVVLGASMGTILRVIGGSEAFLALTLETATASS